jgi:ribosomal protein S18 acetylase RimI-like enzyme
LYHARDDESRMNAGRAEAAFWAAFLHNRNVDAVTAGDGAVAVAGGYALFVGGTWIDRVLGAGSTRALRADDCEVVEGFYGDRGAPARFELDAEVLERDEALLRDRGYADEGDELVILEGPTAAAAAGAGIAVRRTTDRRAWADLVARSFDAEPGAALRATLQANAAAAQVLVVASIDGTDVGAAALGVAGDTAILYSAGVLPGFRRRGVHEALLVTRLGLASGRGAATAVLKAKPDSAAERSAVKRGFVRTALRSRVRREAM